MNLYLVLRDFLPGPSSPLSMIMIWNDSRIYGVNAAKAKVLCQFKSVRAY